MVEFELRVVGGMMEWNKCRISLYICCFVIVVKVIVAVPMKLKTKEFLPPYILFLPPPRPQIYLYHRLKPDTI